MGGAGGCTSIERLVGELGDDGEIREMGTRDGVEERRKGGGKPRELPGDEWIHELSATGSVRGRHEVEGEQPPKVPDKS